MGTVEKFVYGRRRIKMTNEEAIGAIKCNYPPENYTRLREALDMAIEALEKQMHNCEECKHANYYDWCTLGNHQVLCREHNAIMRDDNCCRDWTPLE